MTRINDIPPFAEEITIENTEQTIQEILNRDEFKKPVPDKFVKLTNAKENNWGSTEGLDKTLCERYLFVRENKRIYLDIPYDLVEKLELPIGKSFPWPFHLKPEVLEREEIEGAITIKNEEEIFIDKPVLEKNIEKELVKRLEELESLRDEKNGLKEEKKELQEQNKRNKKILLLSLLRGKGLLIKLEKIKFKVDIRNLMISKLKKGREEKDKKIVNLEEELQKVQERAKNLQVELDKEKGWLKRFIDNESIKFKVFIDHDLDLQDKTKKYWFICISIESEGRNEPALEIKINHVANERNAVFYEKDSKDGIRAIKQYVKSLREDYLHKINK